MGKTMSIKREEVELMLHVLNTYKHQVEIFYICGDIKKPQKQKQLEERIEDTEELIDKIKKFIEKK